MEVRRLLTALVALQKDLTELQIQEELDALADAVEEHAGAPTDNAIAETFAKATEALITALKNAKTNIASSSIRLALRDVELDSLIGENLLARVQTILGATPFLATRAAQALKKLH